MPPFLTHHIVEIFREVRRVLRKDGTLWLNLGDSYAGSWGAQSRPNGNDLGSTLDGGSMLSARQIQAHPKGQTHTGSLKNTPGLKPKDLVGIPWMVAFALRADGCPMEPGSCDRAWPVVCITCSERPMPAPGPEGQGALLPASVSH